MVNKKAVIVTKEGLKQLKDELKNLQEVVMMEIAQQIKEAKEFGDLSENAEYIEAKERQGATAARIMELENMLQNVEIVDEKKASKSEAVQIGSHVKVKPMDTDDKKVEEYVIVGSMEADPLAGKISNESPLGSALIDKEEGATFEFKAPKGMRKYKLVKIVK